MYQRNGAAYVGTSGGNLTALTGRGYFMAIYAYNSAAAGSMIIADSASVLLVWSGGTAGVLTYAPLIPIACTGGLSVTGSGAVTYMISFATQ